VGRKNNMMTLKALRRYVFAAVTILKRDRVEVPIVCLFDRFRNLRYEFNSAISMTSGM
jgi:hypothetical protein